MNTLLRAPLHSIPIWQKLQHSHRVICCSDTEPHQLSPSDSTNESRDLSNRGQFPYVTSIPAISNRHLLFFPVLRQAKCVHIQEQTLLFNCFPVIVCWVNTRGLGLSKACLDQYPRAGRERESHIMLSGKWVAKHP